MSDHGVLKNLRYFLMQQEDLKTCISGIFTYVPPETPYPYLTLGWEGSESVMQRVCVEIKLEIWSAYYGLREIQELSSCVQRALNDPNLPLEPHQKSLQLKFVQQSLKQEGNVYRLSLGYYIFIKEKEKDGLMFRKNRDVASEDFKVKT